MTPGVSSAGRRLFGTAPGAPRNGLSGHTPSELVAPGLGALESVRSDWNRLALLGGSPFLTYEWVASWWKALGDGEPVSILLRSANGSLRAGACCRLAPDGELTAPTDPAYGYEWDVVAADDVARRDVWDTIARLDVRRVRLYPVLDDGAKVAAQQLQRGGYRVVRNVYQASPYLPLPDSWDELLNSVSKNLRSKWRKCRRGLDQDGGLVFRTARSESDLDHDLDVFLKLEASGWKGRAGTALRHDARAEALYRTFAIAAARAGWLRLSILECSGVPVAAAYGCVFGDRAFRLKSAFNEEYAKRSPGLVLAGEDLRRSIEEGLRSYEFLGARDAHKLRWGSETRDLITLRGYGGPLALPAYAYRAKLRPLLGKARRMAAQRLAERGLPVTRSSSPTPRVI
jgi:CelD/BcsL family acetyltransferase involved in cellulose biosynthesis